MSQLNTRIVLRNDTTEKWSAVSESAILLKGEVGIEFLSDGTPKMKIGNGTSTWSELEYVGGSQANVLEVIPNDGENHQTAINRVATGKSLNAGDVAYVKEAIYVDENDATKSRYSYTGYVYNGSAWAAMDGNYSAENVYFDDDMMVTTAIGYITTTNGSGTIPSKGKNLTQVFEEMFVKEMEPDNNTDPSVSFDSVSSGSKEVGTEVTPTYTAKFSAGSYEYGPATGVALRAETDVTTTGWKVEAKNGSTSIGTQYTDSGSFDKIIVDDNTNYTIKATAYHTAGVTPYTNKGVASTTVAAFTSGSKSKTSTAVTGYRKFFYGPISKDPANLTSADIRALTDGDKYKKGTITIKANGATGLKAFVIAIPDGTSSSITKVVSKAGMTIEMPTSSYALSDIKIDVADKRGGVVTKGDDGKYTSQNNPKAYKLYVWQPDAVGSDVIHDITLG